MAIIDLRKGLRPARDLSLAVAVFGMSLSTGAAAAPLGTAPEPASTAPQVATPGPTAGQTGADFVCHGVWRQTCHFAVLHLTGRRTDFNLASGEARHLDDVAAGVDLYMVSVNTAAPTNASACSRTPAAGKRSAWCKISVVSIVRND